MRTSNNPFSVAPDVPTPQKITHCSLCAQDFRGPSYLVLIQYADLIRVARTVCPTCMLDLGFSKPRRAMDADDYTNLLNRYETALADNDRLRGLLREYENPKTN